VVDDQIGRPTFTADLAAGIAHLLRTKAPFGTYNLTNDGDPASWADVAAAVFAARGRSADDVGRTSTEAYFADKPPSAVRRPPAEQRAGPPEDHGDRLHPPATGARRSPTICLPESSVTGRSHRRRRLPMEQVCPGSVVVPCDPMRG
jgi:hypothetical protein